MAFGYSKDGLDHSDSVIRRYDYSGDITTYLERIAGKQCSPCINFEI